MADQNIIPLVVVNRSIAIHDLSEYISTDLAKGRAEDDPDIGLEPPKSRHELMDASEMVPRNQLGMIEQREHMRLGILDIGNRSKSEVLVDE